MNPIVSPSLLACDFLNIENELRSFENIENIWFHLDIMDGHFVPNLTFGAPIIKMIANKTRHFLDAHLMVTNPEFHIELLKDHGISNFTFHYEATSSHLDTIKKAKKHFPSVGVSVRPNTKINELSDDILKNVDLILIMSVEPGFGGQRFIENTFLKIEQLKARAEKINPKLIIQVDGGVNEENAKQLRKAGANNLVAGSYIFKADAKDYQNQLNKLL